jgi:hypothetical protein
MANSNASSKDSSLNSWHSLKLIHPTNMGQQICQPSRCISKETVEKLVGKALVAVRLEIKTRTSPEPYDSWQAPFLHNAGARLQMDRRNRLP